MEQGKPPVSFVGLGAMGFGMATTLVHEGYHVTGFDVYAPTLERFREAGGEVAATPAAAVTNTLHCICMVATAQQAQAVLLGDEDSVVGALPQGAVLYLSSTVSCEYVQALERTLATIGRDDIALIDCPVSGGTVRAANGTLSIMIGGSETAIARGLPILQVLADREKLYIVRGGIGAGSNMKMCHQVLAASQILATSEAMGFASHLGLDLTETAAAIIQSDAWSWMFENRVARILLPSEPLSSAITIITKDTGIVTSEARRVGFPCPMSAAAEQVYFAVIGRGGGAEDDSSVVRVYLEGKETQGSNTGVYKRSDARLTLVINLLRGIHLCSTAESFAFAHRLGLDLEQVFELCSNAAGGSSVLRAVGPDMIEMMRAGGASYRRADKAIQDDNLLQTTANELQSVIDEAQRLKVPLFLGSQALNLVNMVFQLEDRKPNLAREAIVNLWARKASMSGDII